MLFNMTRENKKKIITASIIGGFSFTAIMMFANYFILGYEFSWTRLVPYSIFSFLFYGYLAYRSYKKKLKK